MKWDAAYSRSLDVSLAEAVARIRRSSGGGRLPLLLACEPLGNARTEGFRLAWATPDRAFAKPDEHYYLYIPETTTGSSVRGEREDGEARPTAAVAYRKGARGTR